MNISRGIIPTAKKVVIYGVEGIGKTTLASKFPNPVFLDTEGGTKHMDVARFPDPENWAAIKEAIAYVKSHPDCCKTLVIDTADWAETFCIKHICKGKGGIEDFGYGKGYVYLVEEFKSGLLDELDKIIKLGIHVVITAHAKIVKFEQPDEMGAYDRWGMKLTKHVAPLLKEWADMVLFCNFKTNVVTTKDKKKKATDAERVIYTTHHPCWDAKNRYGLPDEIPFEYSAISGVIDGKPTESHAATVKKPDEPVSKPQTDAEAVPFDEAPVVDVKSVPDDDLKALMITYCVSSTEIEAAVGEKGFFPSDMLIKDYPKEFIRQVLVGQWDKVHATVMQIREKNKKEHNSFKED